MTSSGPSAPQTIEDYRAHVAELEAQLQEARDTLDAIRSGDVDAVVVSDGANAQIYTLQDADRLYRLLIEQMQEGALTLSPDGVVLYCNPAFADLLGATPETVVGRSLHGVVASSGLDGLLARQGRGEVELRAADGAAIPVRMSVSALSLSPPDDADILCAVVTDLSADRRQAATLADARDALRQSQKMEAVGQLTGGVAHDFNNLLTIIRSSADFLRRSDLPEERRRRYVDAIAETVDRAAKLTGQLLAFARRQALKPEIFDACEQVRQTADMLRSVVGGRIAVVTDFAGGGACRIEADVSQFETALVNLAVNARDAMAGEGTLTIRVARADDDPPPGASELALADYVAISVADTGTGIDPQAIGQIFEPFFTTKEVGKGTGLGLSQTYGFAKQSGGDVSVASAPGQGATFTLYLPRIEAIATGRAAGPAAAADVVHRGEGQWVLVVEDNRDVGAFSTQLLQDLGYNTVWAAEAEEALALLDSHDGRFDAVFSDVVMPGMGGVELGRLIRARYPELPVLLTSGYSEVLAEEGRHGFELLQKPYSIEALSRALKDAMGSSAERSAGAPA